MKYLFIVFAGVLILSSAHAGERLDSPKYYVDTNGHYIGSTRDVVDTESGSVVRTVSPPGGGVLVATPPSAPGMKWNFEATSWVSDPDYVAPIPPTPEPDATAILNLLVERGIITEADKNSLLHRGGE